MKTVPPCTRFSDTNSFRNRRNHNDDEENHIPSAYPGPGPGLPGLMNAAAAETAGTSAGVLSLMRHEKEENEK